MPRQIKKGLKQFKEVKPFIEEPIENTRWWKIEINPLNIIWIYNAKLRICKYIKLYNV